MSYNFSGRKILVTGASRGIGRGVVEALVKAGADVVALARSPDNLAALARDFPTITTVQADVADIQATKAALAAHHPFHGLVNNAGVIANSTFLDMTPEDFDKVLSVNLRGATFVAQAVAAGMAEAGHKGSIVNLSSASARGAVPGLPAYCIAKAGMDALTRVMALELGPRGIRVNSVNPTVVETDMGKQAHPDPAKRAARLARIPLGRFAGRGVGEDWAAELEEVTAAVLWLLSEQSAMTTGAAIPIEGGIWFA